MNPTQLQRDYWRRNLRYLAILLTVWFVVSYVFAILFVDDLDKIRIGGFKLGFWFAQQGSIYVFVVLIFVYVRLMNRLDRRYREDLAIDAALDVVNGARESGSTEAS